MWKFRGGGPGPQCPRPVGYGQCKTYLLPQSIFDAILDLSSATCPCVKADDKRRRRNTISSDITSCIIVNIPPLASCPYSRISNLIKLLLQLMHSSDSMINTTTIDRHRHNTINSVYTPMFPSCPQNQHARKQLIKLLQQLQQLQLQLPLQLQQYHYRSHCHNATDHISSTCLTVCMKW